MGHTMKQQWGIPWSSNGAYHGAYHEQEKGIHGAAMGHTMEQQWGIPWSNDRAYTAPLCINI